MQGWELPEQWDAPIPGDPDRPPTGDPDVVYAADVVITDFAEDDGSGSPGYVPPSEWAGNVPTDPAQQVIDAVQADDGDSIPLDPDAPEEDIFEEVA